MLSTIFSLPLSPLLFPFFQPISPQSSPPLFLSLLTPSPSPSTPQVLLESALKHWSRVKRYVAQDGSG